MVKGLISSTACGSLGITKAIRGMVVHHSYRLHEGIANGGAHEIKSPFFQVQAHRIRLRSYGEPLFEMRKTILLRFPVDKLPYVFVESTEFFADGQKSF